MINQVTAVKHSQLSGEGHLGRRAIKTRRSRLLAALSSSACHQDAVLPRERVLSAAWQARPLVSPLSTLLSPPHPHTLTPCDPPRESPAMLTSSHCTHSPGQGPSLTSRLGDQHPACLCLWLTPLFLFSRGFY